MRLNDTFKTCPGLYIMYCSINGKYYVGESMNVQSRMVFHRYCKTQVISKAIIKHGIENFTIQVEYLPDFKKDDLLDLEEECIKRFGSLIPNGYNVCARGSDNTGVFPSEETRLKMSIAKKGRKQSPEFCKKLSENKKGNTNMLGKQHSEDTKRRISEGNIGKFVSIETREKISKHRQGTKASEETKLKISKSGMGRIWSESSKEKISNTKLKYYIFKNPNGERIEIHGLAKYAKENKLSGPRMCSLYSGKISKYKGWQKWEDVKV